MNGNNLHMMKTFLLSILVVLSPIQEAILGIGFLIFADLIMGLVASYKNNIPITSKRLKNTGVKLLIYNLLLISSLVCEKYLVTWLPFIKICLTFLCIVEFKSIGENFQKITGLPLIKYIKSYIDKQLNSEDK